MNARIILTNELIATIFRIATWLSDTFIKSANGPKKSTTIWLNE